MESDIDVSHTACDAPKKGLDIAAPGSPTLSVEIIVTSAVSVHVFVDGTMVVEGAERVKRHAAEGELSTPSERVPDLVDGKGKEPTATALEGAECTAYYTLEDDSVLPSEMLPEIVNGKLGKSKEVAHTDCGLSLIKI